MSDGIIIRLAGAPVAKGRPRIGKLANGRPVAFTPSHTRSYESHLRYAATEAMAGRAMFLDALEMTITATLPIPASWSQRKQRQALAGLIHPVTRPDADNYAKISADALNQLVYRDDSQIVRLTVAKVYGATPALTIEVRPFVADAA